MADRVVRGPRMQKHWHEIKGATILFTVSTTQVMDSLALSGPWTALRMIGEYIISPTSLPTALDAVTVGIGIGVVSTDAVVVGGSAMPDPTGEPDYPWLYWADHDFYFIDNSLETVGSPVGQLRQRFDVKSMRKIKPRESLAFVAQYSDIVGAPPMRLSTAATRILVAT